MNILLTGASGFVGSHIYAELAPNHTVVTLGRTPVGRQHITSDLSRAVPDLTGYSFDLIVNAAGKSNAILRTKQELDDYEQVNVQGTARLLNALDKLPTQPKALVHLSTVLVYGRLDGVLLDENTPLKATDGYGQSKIRSEQLIQAWSQKTGVRVTILRLPMVVAEPPTGNIAAMKTAIRRGYYVRIGNGTTRRSMVRADDVAGIITQAVQVEGTFNFTDGCHPTIYELENALFQQVGRVRAIPAVPLGVAREMAWLGDGISRVAGRRFPFDSVALQKLTLSLTFCDAKARQQLNWNPRPVLDLFQCP